MVNYLSLSKEFVFPARHFSNNNFSRSFKSGWFQQWNTGFITRKTLFKTCFTCWSAVEKRLLNQERIRADNALVKEAFQIGSNLGKHF